MSIIFSRPVVCLAAAAFLSLSIHTDSHAKPAEKKHAVDVKARKVSLNPDELGEFANFTQWREAAGLF